MSDEALTKLLPALDIVAFERVADGAFRALASPPPWFARLGRDGAFPFLGHILDEAGAFWQTRVEGTREWGPCAEVDESGAEFHYMVRALIVGERAYLVFQLDQAAERMREVLQKVRSEALDADRARRARSAEPGER